MNLLDGSGVLDIELVKGLDDVITLLVTDNDDVIIPLDGYSFVLEKLNSDGTVTEIISSTGTGITITPAEGKLVLTFTSTFTAAQVIGSFQYQLRYQVGSYKDRYLKGAIKIIR